MIGLKLRKERNLESIIRLQRNMQEALDVEAPRQFNSFAIAEELGVTDELPNTGKAKSLFFNKKNKKLKNN